jgi:Uri superfamily endonuclease
MIAQRPGAKIPVKRSLPRLYFLGTQGFLCATAWLAEDPESWKALPLFRKPGCYVLVLKLPQARELFLGALGRIFFPPGIYLYLGSAQQGLGQRVRRYARPPGPGKAHWHVDWLRKEAKAIALGLFPWVKQECQWARKLWSARKLCPVAPHFGTGDCRCPTHLFCLPWGDCADCLRSWDRKAGLELIRPFLGGRVGPLGDGFWIGPGSSQNTPARATSSSGEGTQKGSTGE